MSSETALTGRFGSIYLDNVRVARTTQWAIDTKLAHTSEWGDSDSGGYTNRMAGRVDGTFTTEGKYDVDSPTYELFGISDVLEVYLYLSASERGGAVDLHYHFPRALCMSFKLAVNIDTEDVIGWSADWGTDGIWYHPFNDVE